MNKFSVYLAPVAFVVSVAFLSLLYGVVASWWGWFPAPQIGLAHRTMRDVAKNWENDVGLVPTRHLVRPSDPNRPADDGFRMYQPDAAAPGYTLVSGLSPDQDVAEHMVTLYDSAGNVVHRWPIHYDALDPEGRDPLNVLLHGMEVFEDGSLAVTFDAGNALARVDPCGKPIWTDNGHFHHAITRDGDGGLMTWRDETIVRLDAATGEVLDTLDLTDDIIPAGDPAQTGVFRIRTVARESGEAHPLKNLEDPYHPNDVERLRAGMADAFPFFEAGDLLISLRALDLVAVVDPETGLLRWWQNGPWLKQHDPDFQPDGTITIFDNAPGSGTSRITRIDPETRTMDVLFEGDEAHPFYSWRRGKHQLLGNGDILITEAEKGRVFEVDPAGELVWERDFVWDAARNLIVTEARHLPPDFFDGDLPSCGGPSELQAAKAAASAG